MCLWPIALLAGPSKPQGHYSTWEREVHVRISGQQPLSYIWSQFFCFNQVNTLRPRQDERHFADDIFTCIFFNENCCILIKFSLKYAHKGPINNNPALVQIMAWRRSGDKPLSEPMMISLLTHICVTRPQWVKHAWISIMDIFYVCMVIKFVNFINSLCPGDNFGHHVSLVTFVQVMACFLTAPRHYLSSFWLVISVNKLKQIFN